MSSESTKLDEVFCWVHAWVNQNATSRALLIEDQIKRGQLSGRLTPDIARGVLTRYGGRLLWVPAPAVQGSPRYFLGWPSRQSAIIQAWASHLTPASSVQKASEDTARASNERDLHHK
ncbi:hypothetical protein B0H10DRAFT_1960439 [Mycena sp. CBHHK59/15]|nr:hypothetical protein B0H10DRAFT_1960439 [Mycena sp. CBHHK59/15]